MKKTEFGISYDFNKFMHSEITYQEIEEFFKQYDLKEDTFITHVNDWDFVFFNRAMQKRNDFYAVKVEGVQLSEEKESYIACQYVEYLLTNFEGNNIKVIITDSNGIFDPKKKYKEL